MLVELVGPAGAGKSSLLAALRARQAEILSDLVIPPWRYVPDAVGLAPVFIRFHTPFRGLYRKEMKRVLYLTTLHRMVAGQSDGSPSLRIFDEGPVYMLARMLHRGEQRFENDVLRRWWEEAAGCWARTLHLVVWLDAESVILARRIRSRTTPPPVADTRDATLIPFLDRYRRCYGRVLQAMAAGDGGPAIMRFDTGQTSFESIVARVCAALQANAGD